MFILITLELTYPRKRGDNKRIGTSAHSNWGFCFLGFFGDKVIKNNSFLFFYSIFLLMCLEKEDVLEVALSGRGQIPYLRNEGLPGSRGKLYKLAIKWTSSRF